MDAAFDSRAGVRVVCFAIRAMIGQSTGLDAAEVMSHAVVVSGGAIGWAESTASGFYRLASRAVWHSGVGTTRRCE